MMKTLLASTLALTCLAGNAMAFPGSGPIMRPAGYDANTFARNDDGSTGPYSFTGFGGFAAPINFYGVTYSDFWLNNNGNITFTGPLSTFTPFGITSGSTPMLAPFFADVDTRAAGNPVTFGAVGGSIFCNWENVDYFGGSASHVNRNWFQLVITDMSGSTGTAGDFDFCFNYEQIQWETGTASGGDNNGLGGTSAHVGYTNGAGSFFEFGGSGVNGALLDGGSDSLTSHSNTGIAGRYCFSVRNGVVTPTVPVPSAALAGLGTLAGIAGFGVSRRRRNG